MGGNPARFSPEDLEPLLRRFDVKGWHFVAFSGGADSTALLLALHELKTLPGRGLRALHVNHGVHRDAHEWAAHCKKVCLARNIPFDLVGPPGADLGPGSPEERLRTYRYDAFARHLGSDDVMCTAHHQQDQAETLLLALLRGSGPAGLAAMPESRPLARGRLLRPLLNTDADLLRRWLKQRSVEWIEDPSNQSLEPDRNFLRQRILPALRDRWPATVHALATSARLQSEALELLENEGSLALAGRLSSSRVFNLRGLDPGEASFRTLVRLWLKRADAPSLPRARLAELGRQLESARNDGCIEVAWDGVRLRHYRQQLWLDNCENPKRLEAQDWTPPRVLELGSIAGTLRADQTIAATPLRVRGRDAKDRIRPAPGRPSTSLKAWFSTSPMPPWLRDLVPVIVGENGIAALGDVILDQDLKQQFEDPGQAIHWQVKDDSLAWAWSQCRASLLGVE